MNPVLVLFIVNLLATAHLLTESRTVLTSIDNSEKFSDLTVSVVSSANKERCEYSETLGESSIFINNSDYELTMIVSSAPHTSAIGPVLFYFQQRNKIIENIRFFHRHYHPNM